MNGEYLLDTNIVIALFVQNVGVMQRLAAASVSFIPSVVVGELYFGARKSGRVAQNVARIERFLEDNVVLDVDTATARNYGQIKNALRMIGHPIPENDLWIAAIAVQHGLTLATRDQHFQHAAGLSLEMW